MATNENVQGHLPGMEVVGRGISLKPFNSYELKDVLFKSETTRPYYSKETQQTYQVPVGYEINDSPPMPAKQALNQVMIEESWERFDKTIGLDANSAVSSGVCNIDATASQASQLNSKEDCYYALRNSFIPLWAVYLSNVTKLNDEDFDLENIKPPFKHSDRRIYEKFFERYGTHYVKRAWVGGKAMLAFTIAKATNMTKEEIKLGITASYGVGSGKMNKTRMENKEKLQNNSECTVFGKGGDELSLAALSSLDETSYNNWLKTIKDNPQIIELEAVGIWTLIDDKDISDAVRDAYKAATTYTPVSAGFRIDKTYYFIRRDKYFTYDIVNAQTQKPKDLETKWPALEKCGFKHVDAAFKGPEEWPATGEDLSKKIFFFRRGMYMILDAETGEVEEGHPKPIKEQWPGLPFNRIDAVFCDNVDSMYFFLGGHYVRFDLKKGAIDDVYPEPFAKRWAGVNFDRIDAIIYGANEKVYFFRNEFYVRYDMVTYQADPGYPKTIVGSYVEDWTFVD